MKSNSVSVTIGLGLGVLALMTFAIMQWLHIPAGTLLDWFIGMASFYWLLAIVTIPWNIFFAAKEVLAEAEWSQQQGITLEITQIHYAQQVAKWGVSLAIILHLSSAVGLYGLAASGISAVGYVSAVATLLLTVLRPAIRTYHHVAHRLGLIQQQVRYPRQDVVQMQTAIHALQETVTHLSRTLDPHQSDSIVSQHQQEMGELRQRFAKLKAWSEEAFAQNQQEHDRLKREIQQSIAQLTEDSQFLLHARELIRFFKDA
ncbi:MAG: hypothetical protein VKL39_05290 [Leptolyngbyaceae bacterium]|nr:hypothetical protein [Leptolyngbyaceae bacterium]